MSTAKYPDLSKKGTLNLTLIRTYKPEPNHTLELPIGILFLISSLRDKYPGKYRYNIIDMQKDSMSPAKAHAEIKRLNSDIVGISAFTSERHIVSSIVSSLKESDPGIPVVIGGPYASASTELALKDNPKADFIFMGEGEERFPELLNALTSNSSTESIDGIAYNKDGKTCIKEKAAFIKNLDSIPHPAWDIIDIDSYNNSRIRPTNYFRKKSRSVPLFSSRGCPYQCAYCHKMFGKTLRVRSAENFFSEIADLYENHGVRELHILDDAFNLAKERMRKICQLIIDNRMSLSIGFPNGLRGDQLDFDDIDLLKQAGTYFIRYAVETGSRRIQDLIHKYAKLDKLMEIISYTSKRGIFTQGFFMLGFPTETIEEINMTIDFALKSDLHAMAAFQVVPFPGTDLYDMAREINPDYEYDDRYLFFSGKSFYQEITGIDLNPIIKRMYQRFYYNPKRAYRIIRDLPEKASIFNSTFSLIKNSIMRNIWMGKH